jgi:uncharacterized protein (DUF305 family)
VNRTRAAAIAVSTVALAGVLAACGSDDDAGTTTSPSSGASSMPSMSGEMSGDHNEQDASFAQNMIMHHQEAIEMAKLAPSRAQDPEVTALAARIEAAQQPEIDTMSGWLESWGMAMPSDMAGMDMGSMPGKMSEADMTKLEAAKGAEFDEMFLTMMIAHHEGAVTMAQTQVSAGSDAEAKALAQKVIADQTAEIAEMRKLLG